MFFHAVTKTKWEKVPEAIAAHIVAIILLIDIAISAMITLGITL